MKHQESTLDDWQFMVAIGFGLGALIILLVGIAAAVRSGRARRAEFARLREDIRQLLGDVKYLVNAEERRFLQQLRSSKDENQVAKNGSPEAGARQTRSATVTLIPGGDSVS